MRVLTALYQGATTLVTVAPELAPDIPLTLRYPGADAPPEGTRAGLRINAAWVVPDTGAGAHDQANHQD
ncbi:hypothetical protein [Rhodospira trueperi]|uniref:hypothetical protein n=1 Tax=Rhodospira trueperi TaxID=69960 RepID=UPI00115F96CD|nr:hypothetical protein [Rhodospira trueperi]